jgi:predicted nucleic acid-binding protein
MTQTRTRGAVVTFDDIPSRETVFLDANCIIYAATSDPQYGSACRRLLEQIDNNVIAGCTSAHVLGDVSHRLMTIEAALKFGRPMTGIANWLRRHPAELQQLSQYRQSLDDLQAIPMTVLPVTGRLVSHAADFSHQYGLLTNDALVVAAMRDHSLIHLASLDSDFDRVPGITRYGPS